VFIKATDFVRPSLNAKLLASQKTRRCVQS
jgi:hypothetical protein